MNSLISPLFPCCQHHSEQEDKNIIFHHTGAEKYFEKSELDNKLSLLFVRYVEENRSKWDQEIQENHRTYLTIKPSKSGLPFTIEYSSDGQWKVHTKFEISRGGSKIVFFSADLERHSLWGRIKYFTAEEIQVTNAFSGCNGIIQLHHITPSSKKKDSYRVTQELYDGTLTILEEKDLGVEEMKIVEISLLEGLAAIHAKGLAHDDVKPANILVRICPKINKVIKVVLCDLGSARDGEHFLFSLDCTQRMEVDRILGLITKLYNLHKTLPRPGFIRSLRSIPDDDFYRERGILPKEAATASEALQAFKKYYSESKL